MKKFVVGLIIGAVAMYAGQAGAAQFIGSKVAGTKDVTLNGVTIGQAAIINNSSYVPVRSLANGLGLNIDLEGGKINLAESNSNMAVVDPDPTPPPATPTATPFPYTMEAIDLSIVNDQTRLVGYNNRLKEAKENNDRASIQEYEKLIQAVEADLALWQERKKELEASKGTP